MRDAEIPYGDNLIPHRWYRSIYRHRQSHTVGHVGAQDFICGMPAWIGEWHDSDAGRYWYDRFGPFRLTLDTRKGGKCGTCKAQLKKQKVAPVALPSSSPVTAEEWAATRPRWVEEGRLDMFAWGQAETILAKAGLL